MMSGWVHCLARALPRVSLALAAVIVLVDGASAQIWPEHAEIASGSYGEVSNLSSYPSPYAERSTVDTAWLEQQPPANLYGDLTPGFAVAGDQQAWEGVDEPYFESRSGWQGDVWGWKLLPQTILYRSYLAGAKESRFGSAWVHTRDQGWLWDIALGGRAGILRYGSLDETDPEGFQLDIEGAGLPRLDLEEEHDLVAADFRFGIPLTYRRGTWQAKAAYYHLSSHLGDEFMIKNPLFPRINYSRDVLVLGVGYFVTERLRLYGEAGWAFYCDVCEPWEFQFGFDYAPAQATGLRGAPFVAVNGHLREEVNFGGNLVVQAGWAWQCGPGAVPPGLRILQRQEPTI